MLKPIVKAVFAAAMEYTGLERLRDAVWEQHNRHPAAILCFHRVLDDIPEDAITISARRFEAIIRAVARKYRVVPLQFLVDCIRTGRPWPRRSVAISFDDGYLDNARVAAPILTRYGVPATFFVLPGLLGTDTVLPWDRHLAGRARWMTWEDVLSLQCQGFDIGSHTMTHMDLGTVPSQTIRNELTESKSILETSLSREITLFAYPFGGPANINEEALSLVREAGYACCFSAYGGLLRGRVDPFRIPRVPINNWFRHLVDIDFELRLLAPWLWGRR